MCSRYLSHSAASEQEDLSPAAQYISGAALTSLQDIYTYKIVGSVHNIAYPNFCPSVYATVVWNQGQTPE